MGNFPNLIFCSVYVLWNDGDSKLVGEDSMSFHESRMNKEFPCSRVEEDRGVHDCILSFRLACNRKSECE